MGREGCYLNTKKFKRYFGISGKSMWLLEYILSDYSHESIHISLCNYYGYP